jgi:hypothetical protein
VQQMPGRDAYLDGLLVLGNRRSLVSELGGLSEYARPIQQPIRKREIGVAGPRKPAGAFRLVGGFPPPHTHPAALVSPAATAGGDLPGSGGNRLPVRLRPSGGVGCA